MFLIDHAWTTSPARARDDLLAHPTLLDRIENMFNIEAEAQDYYDEGMVGIVAAQTGVSKQRALEALEANSWDLINSMTVHELMAKGSG